MSAAALREIVSELGVEVAHGLEAVYIRSAPDSEIAEGAPEHYDLVMLLLCKDQGTQEHLERGLTDRLARYEGGAVVDQLKFQWHVELTSRVFVSDLATYERFAEWDYLSGLEDVRDAYARETV